MTINTSKPHILSIAQFAFSGLGLLFLWGLALINVFSGIFQLVKGGQSTEAGIVFLVAVDFGVLGLLTFPSTFYSFMRLIHHPIITSTRPISRKWLAILLVWPLILYLGLKVIDVENWAFILFPVAQVMAVLLLVIWMYLVAGNGLHKMSPQRTWGLLSAGMIGGTLLSMLAEIIGVILIISGFILLVLFIPSLQNEVSRLAEQISSNSNDIDALMRILSPYLSQPVVVITLVFSASIAVPLVEEALKPIGLWFLARKSLTPSEGFLGGVISGAGFAIVESLFNSTQVLDSTWLLVSSIRFGTTLMHMLASGLVGWGLASAWTQRKYLRLIGAYLSAVILHGVWNGLAILLAASQISPEQSGNLILSSGKIALWGLGVWTLVAFILLLLINARLRLRPETIQVN
jgi:protease PrsW